MSTRAKANLLLLSATAFWGAAGPIIKFTLGGIDPLPFLSYRLFLSGIVGLIILIVFRPKMPKNIKDYGFLVLYGLLSTTISLGFLFSGLDRTTVLELGIIGAVSPLIIVMGGGILLNEHVTKREKNGIFIAIFGILITIFSPILLGHDGFKFSGNILLLLFLLSDASGMLLAKRMLKHKFSPLAITNFAFIVGALTFIPFAIATIGVDPLINAVATLPIKYHLGVWYMALVSGTIAYFLFIRGTKSIEVGEAGLFAYLQPIFSVPLAVFWLGEAITFPFVVGGTITALGVYIAERKKG